MASESIPMLFDLLFFAGGILSLVLAAAEYLCDAELRVGNA